MKYVNEFGIEPKRGNAAAAGIDFFVPDPSKWTASQTAAFMAYLKSKDDDPLKYMTADGIERSDRFLYFCHDFYGKKGTEYTEWRNMYLTDDHRLRLAPLQSVLIPTGVRVKLDDDCAGIFLNKSGIGIQGLVIKAQVIDKDYTGFVHLNLVNVSDHPVIVSPGQKLSQMVEIPVRYGTPEPVGRAEYLEAMSESDRGENMAGSTGLFS